MALNSTLLNSSSSNKKLVLLIVVNLIILCFFKVYSFYYREIVIFSITISFNALPVGISFYTFQLIAFAVDTVKQKETIPSFIDYGNFASFFPFIGAGPIERRNNLLPQVQKISFRMSEENLLKGLPIIVLGLFYKLVVADNLDLFINFKIDNNPYFILWTSFLFGLKLYFDFAGYCLIAVGMGKIFGINLTYNFMAPYTARSIREFWQTWNISLMNFFRDYIYIPCGGRRTRFWAFNIGLVWIISGFWHGMGLNFIIWGLFHGILIITYHFVKDWIKIPSWLGWFLTFTSVNFSWLFFYETNNFLLLTKFKTIFTPSAYSQTELRGLLEYYSSGDLFPISVILGFAILILLLENLGRSSTNPYNLLVQYPATFIMVLLFPFLLAGKMSQFIYFAF